MPNSILVFTANGVCLVKADADSWQKYGISIYKTAYFEETVKELNTGRYLLLVISLNKGNAVLIQQQLKILRSLSNIPIAVVAEETVDTTAKIASLINGADQYMELPLSPDEAALSILALIRRYAEFSTDGTPITVYFDHGIVLTYDQILEKVWGMEYIDSDREIVWNQIRRLRDKIQIAPDLPRFIKTVHGIGYSFDPKHIVA